jgi:cytochrome c biogenesis protein CcmG, thiol:disulfide interchange protein DsbE
MKLHPSTSASLAFLIGTAMSSLTNAWAESPQKTPTFSLSDLDGKTWTQMSFAGKPLVVDFWATWCATCKETVPKLAELATQYKSKGLNVIGISVDKGSDEKIRKEAKKLGINYLILRDKDNSMSKSFGFNGIPSLYVFDAKGNLSLALPGYDPDQEKTLEESVKKVMVR